MTTPRVASRNWRNALGVGALLCFASGPQTASPTADSATAVPIPVERVLDNGLKVVVREDHRAPVVVSQIWYKIGASYEPGGLTGVSHVLEHMMFKGTKQHGRGEFSRLIAAQGGEENAFTGADYTAYFQTMAADRLEVSLRLEADRMRGLLLDEAEFKKELQVVMEERRLRTEDDPGGLTYEQFNATAFANHPYRNPIIGWMTDLEQLAIEDLRDWYRHWYSPNNATLVVVGDVDPEAVFALARKHFGAIPTAKVKALKTQREIPQLGGKRIQVKTPAELPQLYMGFHVPSLASVDPKGADAWEPYAIEVLAAILDGGASARFASRLQRGSELAAAASASYQLTTRAAGQFVVSGTPARGRGIAELEQALLKELALVREQSVSGEELGRVKQRVIAADVYERDSIFYQAMKIGVLETVGLDWRLADRYVENIQKVTPAQIQAVAAKYLREDNLTVATLDPLPLDPASARRPPPPLSHGH